MDYIIGAIALFSLGVNLLIYRRITATYAVGEVEYTDLEPVHDCCKVILEFLHTEEDPVPEKAPEPKKNPEAYQAWTNRQGIPMVPPVKPPEPIIKAPNRGPLARPDGFV